MINMQSSMLNSARHHPPSPALTARRPIMRLRRPTHLPRSNSNSNQSSPSPISPKMGHVSDLEFDAADQIASPEAKKIIRNSLYLTFNAPQVDDYHRGIFLTHPPSISDPEHQFSGTLFHASYTPPADSPKSPPTWILEQRGVRDVSSSQSLVLLFRICTLDLQRGSIESQCDRIRSVLDQVPLGRHSREAKLGHLAEDEGNPLLDGYDCVIWTIDAIKALADARIFSLADLGFESAGEVMAAARKSAGPVDAKSMVGVDFGGLRVSN